MDSFPLSLKYPLVLGGALIATGLCFLVMLLLIRTELDRNPPPERVRIAANLSLETFERDIHEPERSRPERLLPAEPPPDPDGLPITAAERTTKVMAERPMFPAAEMFTDAAIDFELSPPAQDLMPVYVVQPVYPFSAVMKEIEGYVVISFGVRPNGTVINPVVVESRPGSLFDDAALSAIDKFRFRPRTLHGDALAVNDMKMRFVFTLTAAGGQTRVQGHRPVFN